MDVREKLVELLNEAFFDYNHGKGDGYIPKNFADHLIANGVTVQEWISVAEPPPKRISRRTRRTYTVFSLCRRYRLSV